MRDRLRQEDGIALVLALGFCIVLSILVFSVTQYVTSNQTSARNSSANQLATSYAESALNTAYSRIVYANQPSAWTSGLSPSKPNLLGCATSSVGDGSSDCSSPAPLCVSFTVACPTGSYTATAGTATVVGFFTGTNTYTYSGLTEPGSTWILVASGYAVRPNGAIDMKQMKATVTISAASAGAVASVWNHIFMTAPLVAGQCQANFGGNNMLITTPLYVIGNLCLSGQGVAVKEVSGGQAVDLQVGGALSLSGSGAAVGDYSTNPATAITSGVVVGGCTNGAIGTTTGTCTNGSYKYSVKSQDVFVSQSAPEESDADMLADYSNFDPGPKHPCASGSGTLAQSAFDSSLNGASEPDISGSTTNGSAFELAPGSSYTCVSQNGSGTGQLSWNASTHTLTVNGSIFLDSNLTISQNVTYVGTAVIEVAGTVTVNNNGTTICAINTSCLFTNWQGSSGHNDMLTLVALKKNASPAIQFTNNSQTFQGSLWTQPSSSMNFVKNGVTLEGPLAVGSFDATFNNATIKPLPIIKNMPVGAPVPPNVSASISPLNVVG